MSGTRIHFWLTVCWIAMVIPTVLWWQNSILWVLMMSIWANAATHWGAYQAARAERTAVQSETDETGDHRCQPDR